MVSEALEHVQPRRRILLGIVHRPQVQHVGRGESGVVQRREHVLVVPADARMDRVGAIVVTLEFVARPDPDDAMPQRMEPCRHPRQIERHADIYMSRVSNFLHHTPFFYFRSPRGSLPHDP